ncbi:MAG: hypothetical protein GF320_06120 [Armatimonadia bacterium]|nr:hypothetical protein [Armatimonadia bacterium]
MPSIDFGALDYGMIVAYFAAIMIAGLLWLRRNKTSDDYFLAGRTLTIPAFVATLVATWYGGILGVGEFTYQFGISNWVVFGVPYYIFAAVFAIWLAPRIRQASLYTIPDKIDEAYGKPAAVIGAAFTYCLTTPAPYVLMLGTMLQLIFGWPIIPAMLAGVVLSTVYVYAGGFQSDVRVNIVQFVLMFAGFALMLGYCVSSYGGFEALTQKLPEGHLTWSGGNSAQYIIAWFFIALWTLVDPSFHQRCYAAKSPEVAKRGVFVSIGFWMIFDFLTCAVGLYARAAMPGLTETETVMAYPLLADSLLPAGAKGLFFVGLLATIMSTLVSTMFMSGVTFTRDFVYRLVGGDPDERLNLRTIMGLLLTTGIAIALAVVVPSVVDLWYTVGTVLIPGLLLPLLTAYWPRFKIGKGAAAAVMLLSTGTSLAWLIAGALNPGEFGPQYPLGLEPMYPGLAVSVVGFAFGRILRRG